MPWGNDDNGPKSPWGSKRPERKIEDKEEFFRDSQDKLKKLFTKKSQNNNFDFFNKQNIVYGIVGIFLLWLMSGLFTVMEGEQAAVVRLGKFTRIAGVGLNYHLPYPFETIIKKRVDQIEREEIGFRSNGMAKVVGKSIPEESLMLTGDENIVDINFVIQWKIRDIKEFIFSVNKPAETVKASAESALREVIALSPIASALAEGKSEIEFKAKELLQAMMDNYKIGVEIVNVQMLKADPPSDVIDAFRDVQTARADKEREINQAETYRNDIIPRARGQVEKVTQEAEGYKEQSVAKAQGESARFLALYNQYKLTKDVTRKRLYIESMEEILQNIDKIIVDKGAGSTVPYLALDKLKPGKPNKEESNE